MGAQAFNAPVFELNCALGYREHIVLRYFIQLLDWFAFSTVSRTLGFSRVWGAKHIPTGFLWRNLSGLDRTEHLMKDLAPRRKQTRMFAYQRLGREEKEDRFVFPFLQTLWGAAGLEG